LKRAWLAVTSAAMVLAVHCNLFVDAPERSSLGPSEKEDAESSARDGEVNAAEDAGNADALEAAPDVKPAPNVRKGCDCPGFRSVPPAPIEPLDRTEVATGWTGKEYLIWGGRAKVSGRDQSLSDGAAFDPVANTWRALPPAPLSPRHDLAAAFVGGLWILWGGKDARSGLVLRDGAAFAPDKNQWTKLPDAPTDLAARHGPAVLSFAQSLATGEGAMSGDGVFLWGGTPDFGDALSDGAWFSPASQTWSMLPPSTLAGRRPYAARVLENAIVRGGEDCPGQFGPDPCQDGAEYSIASRTWTAAKPISKTLFADALAISCELPSKTAFFLAPSESATAAGRGTYLVGNDANSALTETIIAAPPPSVVPAKISLVYAGCIQNRLVAFGYNKSRVVGATFDPAKGTWTANPEPEQLTKFVQLGAKVQVGGDELLIWGGSKLLGGNLFSHIYQP
jgi:hypothetical protein